MTCTAPDCPNKVKARGLCFKHYQALRDQERGDAPTCTLDECSDRLYAKGLCHRHYNQTVVYGEVRRVERRTATETCTVDGCQRPHSGRGLCLPHYKRWYKTGDAGGAEFAHRSATPLDRMQAYIDVTGFCWLWTGATQPKGYGIVSGGLAHRWVYEQLIGPVPGDLELDHLCFIRNCVNPDHLDPVTHDENLRRAQARVA